MERRTNTPFISVIVPTRNRSHLLAESLGSLAQQTLARHEFEVIVIDDGSADGTARVCERAAARIDLHYVRIDHAGIAAAKNVGIFVSSAPLLFFFDDDDIASPELLERHTETHRAHPAESVVVLGYTTWAAGLKVTPVMHYLTDVGGLLFCYGPIRDGQWLDFTYFWGGRSSCKRALLTQHGIFNQAFTSITEDIELGYRLTRFDLQVIHNREAVQYMNRSITYDEFCARCERQGRSLWSFSRLHADPRVQKYCEVHDLAERWANVAPQLARVARRVRVLEAAMEAPRYEWSQQTMDELHSLYSFTFAGFKLKGMIAALVGSPAAKPRAEPPGEVSPGTGPPRRIQAQRNVGNRTDRSAKRVVRRLVENQSRICS